MSECHTFKVDDVKGVPDRLVREFINECERKLGFVRVTAQPLTTKSAVLLCVIVVKADDFEEIGTQPTLIESGK